MGKEIKETTELKHKPEPGYEKIFKIVLSVAVLYLCIIFLFG
jgi:hypothetical protein|tara:strand:- start:398 stop:523 length:126 start_codon:yes stop_codon:yes gene_type:complete